MARLGVKANLAWWLGTPAVRPSYFVSLVARGFNLGRYIIDADRVEKVIYTEINGFKTGWVYRLGRFKTVEFWTDRLLLTMTIAIRLRRSFSITVNGETYTKCQRLPMCIDPEWFSYRRWADLHGSDSAKWLLKLPARNKTEFERLVPEKFRDRPWDYYNYVIKLDRTDPERMRLESAYLYDVVYVGDYI